MKDLGQIRSAVSGGKVSWRRHALERMLSRGISRADVLAVLKNGQIVESDDQRKPFPTSLCFAKISGRPLHVVVAWDAAASTVYIVTVYEPDDEHFEPDFVTRRRK